MEMAVLKVPVICVIIGEGASGGALGIAIGDKVMMLENSWYSLYPRKPLHHPLENLEKQGTSSRSVKAHLDRNVKNKLIDGIIKEPLGGAHQDPVAMAAPRLKNSF